MKHIITLLLLMLFAIASHAEIYKGKDEQGNVTYSDEALPNTTEVPALSPNLIKMPKPVPKKPEEVIEEIAPYETLTILSPADNETIRSPSGEIQVSLSVTPGKNPEPEQENKLGLKIEQEQNTEPGLDTEKGHGILTYIDGKESIYETELYFQIPNISRGKHTLQAVIVDEDYVVLIKSNTVTFHVKRTSELHKKPTGTPSGPKNKDGKAYTPGPQGVTFKPGPVVTP